MDGHKTESQVTESTKESRVTTMCPEGIKKSRESSTVPVCVSPDVHCVPSCVLDVVVVEGRVGWRGAE